MTLRALAEANTECTDKSRATVGIIKAQTAVRISSNAGADVGVTEGRSSIAVCIGDALIRVRITRDTGASVAERIRAPVQSLTVGIGAALRVWVGSDASTSVAEGRGSVTVGVGGALIGILITRSADSINADFPWCGALGVDGTRLRARRLCGGGRCGGRLG
jgi:hypothetical protein